MRKHKNFYDAVTKHARQTHTLQATLTILSSLPLFEQMFIFMSIFFYVHHFLQNHLGEKWKRSGMQAEHTTSTHVHNKTWSARAL